MAGTTGTVGGAARTAALAAGLLGCLGASACLHSMSEIHTGPGTAPSPGVPWSPPASAAVPAPAPAPAPVIPPDLLEEASHWGLADLVDLALRTNPDTRVAWTQARAAAADLGARRGAYYPAIALQDNYSKIKGSAVGGKFTFRTTTQNPYVNLSYLLFDFGGRTGSIEEARQALIAANGSHNATIQDQVLKVELAYYQYLYARALEQAEEAAVKEAQTSLDAASRRREAGVGTIADVLQAKTALSQAQLALESTEGQLQTTRGALALSMGLPANLPYDIAPPGDTTLPLGITDSVDTLIERAARERPDLAAARAEARAAQARVSVARSQALPSLSVGGSGGETYFFNNPASGNSYTATLTLQVPLFSGWSQIYNVKAAAAAAQAAAQAERGLEQQVIYQVFNSYYALRTATQRVRTSADLLASATQSEQVALGRYRAGAGSLLDLLTAQAALADARAQSIQARFSWYVALAALAHDAGILGLDGSSPLHLQTDTTGTMR